MYLGTDFTFFTCNISMTEKKKLCELKLLYLLIYSIETPLILKLTKWKTLNILFYFLITEFLERFFFRFSQHLQHQWHKIRTYKL